MKTDDSKTSGPNALQWMYRLREEKKFSPLMRTKWAWLKNDTMTRGSDITKNEQKARKNIIFFLSMTAHCVPIVAFPSLSLSHAPSEHQDIDSSQNIKAFLHFPHIYTHFMI